MLIAPQLHHCSQQTHAMTAANTTVSYSCKCNRGPANLSTSRTTHVQTNQRGWPHPDNTTPLVLGRPQRPAQLCGTKLYCQAAAACCACCALKLCPTVKLSAASGPVPAIKHGHAASDDTPEQAAGKHTKHRSDNTQAARRIWGLHAPAGHVGPDRVPTF